MPHLLTLLFCLFVCFSCQGQKEKPPVKKGGKGSFNTTNTVMPKDTMPTSINDSVKIAPEVLKFWGISSDSLNTLLKQATDTISVRVEYKGKHYSLFVVDTANVEVEIQAKPNSTNHSFYDLNTYYNTKKKTLLFAMNGGMYESNGQAVGLMVRNGSIVTHLDTAHGPEKKGNFYLQPNGVFAIDSSGKARVMATKEYKSAKIKFATQSGPMMVIDGKINAVFKEGSTNLNIRNAVGVDAKGRIFFVISDDEVNFYEFASLYLHVFNCSNALYLDGLVSRMYLPAINRKNLKDSAHLGPLISVVK